MNASAIPARKGPEPELSPPRVQPRIKAPPKHGQIYWCDFWLDAQLPEMWKTRPVVVLSYKNSRYGPCLVIPTSTQPQGGSPWGHELSLSIVGRRT
jgi:mRNA interferase MazF